MRRFETYRDEATGERFVFKDDPADPTVLHIYARHLTTPEEAMNAFFEGETRWNERYRRYETVSDTHILHWFRMRDGAVMVITCMRKGRATWASE